MPVRNTGVRRAPREGRGNHTRHGYLTCKYASPDGRRLDGVVLAVPARPRISPSIGTKA